MTIEREQQELDDVKEYLENIDKMFPYALPEEREDLKKTVQRDIDVREHRLKRKYNITEAIALQNEAMYDEAEAKKLENTSRAEYALSAMHSAGLKVGTGFAKGVSDIGMGLTGWTARALGGDESTAGAIGRDLMQKNRDFKNMLDEAVIQGTGFDSSKLEGIPGSVVRAGEGLAEMELPMAVVSGVSGLTKLSPLAKTGLEGAMLGLQNIPAHSDYIEQTSGKFKPLASAFTGMASGELMSYAFYFGRTHGMTERAAMNFAKDVASSGVGRTLSEGAKQGLKTALYNSFMNGGLGTGMKEYAALPDNATDKERSRAWGNVGEGLLHEFIMGLGFGFHGGVKETMQAKQRYREMVKSGKEMMSLVKTPEEQKNFIQRSWENTKNTFKDFFSGTARDDTAFDRGVAKYFLDIERQTKLADKTKFDEVFEGSEKNLDDFIKSIQDNVPEEFRKNPAVFGEALDAFKDSLVLERNFIAINKFAEGKNIPFADANKQVFEVNKQGKVITKDEFLRKTYADEMKARLEELKQRKADLEKQKADIDQAIKDKNTTLEEKQNLAKQKEEVQIQEDEVSRRIQTPYTRAEVIEAVRDMVARGYGNNPELLAKANERLADFLSKYNSQEPIGIDDAIGLLNEVESELNRLNPNVKFDNYNSDIEDIINPKLIGSDVIYGNDERNMPTSALPNNTQPQSVLPSSQETPLLEYNPTGRRQMPISEGSNQPINNIDVGSKVNRESPSSFGIVNNVPRSVNMLEKPNKSNMSENPTGSVDNIKPSTIRGKKLESPSTTMSKSQKPEALQTSDIMVEKGELKDRDMPMAVSRPSSEPMAVKKESAKKPNAEELGLTTKRDALIPKQNKKSATEKSSAVENIVHGKKTKMTTKANGGMEVEGQFAVVDVNNLKTSTEIGETQNRNRKTVASQVQINSIANNPNPEYLIVDNADSANGAMVVSPDMVVESGNGRTLGLKMAYENGTAEKYREYLKKNASKFGIDPKEIDKIDNPVLIRIRDNKEGFNVKRFVKESNESRQLGRNSAEIARTDAENIKGILREFNNIDDIASPSNKEFIQKFFEKTVGDTERANYLAEDGSLTPDGLRRVENALIASLYGDNSRLIEKLTNTTNEGIKNIANALMATAKDGAKLKGEVDKGMYFDVDLTKEIGNAALTYADTVAEMQRQGVKGSPINFYLANMKDRLTPEGKLVFGMLSELNKKPKQIREFLQIINDVIRGHGDPQQGDLFAGKNPKPNKSQIIKEALQAFDSRYKTDFSKQDLSKWNKSERTLFGSRTKNKATNPVTDKELNNFLRGQAKQITKETGLSFKVVNSVDELRKMFPNNDITDTVEGGIHKDTVYLVKGNIDKDRLPLVIAHEVAGHRGVESLFENKQQMDNFFNSLERAAAKDKFIRDAFAEVDKLGYKENRSREAMAKIVEKVRNESGTLKGTAKTFVSFISSRVRRLLRRMGFKNLQLSEAEVYDIAVQALRRTGLKNSNKFFGLDRFLAKDNSFLSATSTELDQKYPGWSNRQTTSTGRHSTQAAITEKTYKKIGDWILNSNLKNSKILDASSGMGLGTEALRKMGLNVDDIEPYPGDRKIKPTYSGEDYLDYAEVYKKHGKTYDLIISNAVLNVIPDDWRKAQLHAMADVLLNKGGKIIINVRGDKEVANTKNKIILDSPNEILLPNGNGGYRAYQKGFSQKEFQDWVSKELGAGYKVEKLTPKNSGLSSSTTGVIVTKEGGNGGKRTTESSEREQLDRLAEKAGYNIKAYHGTDKEFDVFKPNNAQGWGKGIYFASEKSDAENYGKNVKEFYISLKNPFDPSDKKANEILDSKAPNTETYKKMAKKTGISDYVDLMNELSENNVGAYRKIIEESGFDGIKAYKSNDINGWEYVIFNPEQAKLADLKTFKDGKEVPLKDRFNKSKADIQFSIGERKPRKVKPDVVSEAEKKILDEIGDVKNPRDYNAVKKIAKNRMAEYKDVFSTKKNTGYKTSALKLHYLLGFDRKTQSVEKAFQSIRDFNILQKTASAYARSIIGDKSTQAGILDSIVKAKTFEKVYDIISKTNIAKEREIRKDLLDDFRNTIKELNPKKISTPTRMYTDEILGESFTPEELDSLIHSNEFTTKAVGKLRNIADNLASELGNIRKSDIEVSEYAINNATRLKHELNEIIKQRDAGNGAMNVPVEKLAEVNQLLKRFINQDKLYKESLDTSAKNAAVADREQILSESPEKNPKTVNSRETNSIGRFKEYILPGKALKTQDNENVAATMGKTMHKVAYEDLLEGQNRQDHYRATGYKGVDRIMESFGKDLEDGREYLDKTAFKVKTSEGHEYEITNNEALAIIANYLDRETGQMIKKAGKVNFYLGEKKDSDYFTFTRKELDDMVNKLTPKQKKAIEDGFALLSNDFLPELNRVYEKLNGVPLRLIQGRYFPRMHVDVTQSDSKGLITKDRAPYIHQQMNADYQGILKQRDAMATPNLNLRGFTDTLQNYTDQASLYIGMAEPLRHLNRIMNGQMKRELTARYGAEYVNRINQMTRLMAGMAGKTEVDKGFATRYLSNLAAAKLTPLSAIKQLTSVPLASSVIPAEYLAKASISGMSNENIKEMMELDGMILRYRSNGIAGIIPVNAKTWGRERIQGEKFKGQKLIDKAVGVGLNLSLMADKRALGIIYKATKLWAESQGKGSDKAWIENKFMEAVRRTQNTTDLASATGWQMDSRESGTMAFLNMYLNQTQKVSNEFFRNKRLMDEAAKKYGKDSAQYKEARNRTATFAASAALMEAMMLAIGSGASMLFKGKDEDSAKDKAVTAVSDLTGNPLLKPMINAYSLQGVLKGKKPTNAAVFGDDFSGMIPEITYTMGRVMNDLQSDDPAAKKFRKLSYDMLSSKAAETSLALGRVPTWFARYPAKFIKRIWGEDLKNTRQKPSTSSSGGSSRLFSGKRTFGNSRTFGGKRMF